MCSICNANRVGPVEGQCPCPENSIDRENLGSPWCATATVAVPEIRFTNDLDEIRVDFGWNVTVEGNQQPFTPSREMCTTILKLSSLQHLGQNLPYCFIDPDNATTIVIQLSDFASILPGDSL